jgi:hypothetical protein
VLLWLPWLCCALLREEEEEEGDLEGSLLLTVPAVLLMLFLLSPAAPLTLRPLLSALFSSLFSPFLSAPEVTATLSELITPVNNSGLPKLNIMQEEEEQIERRGRAE